MMKMKQSFLGKVCLLAMFVICTGAQLLAQKVTGVVVDESKQPIPGVNVLVKGTNNGVITSNDGNYSISNVQANSTLVFTFVGMKPQEVLVGSNKQINVTMKDETTDIEEVVAIGYGVVKRTSLTGSVASVQGKDLAAYPVANAAQALQGKMAGVTITSVDGRPDAKVSIRVRGGGSITQSNDPLFIVDGFPVGNINDIPASQIESINVLKDASSTAIYGARGANGVILVTTKAPKAGKVSITYDGNYQIKTPSKYLGVLNPYDFTLLNWEFGTLFSASVGDAWAMAYGLGTKYSSLNPGGINSYKTATFRDIQKEVLRTAYSQSHNLSISGGNEKTKYSVSINYMDDDGIKIQSSYKRTNIFAKLQQELAKNLILDLDLRMVSSSLLDEESQGAFTGSRLTSALRFSPVTPLGDISGNNSQLGMYDTYVRPAFDPVRIINDIYDRTNNQSVRANVALTWKIIDGLTVKSEYNMSRGYGAEYYYIGAFAKNTVGVEGGNATISMDNSNSYRLVNTLNYAFKGFGNNHNLDVLIGQELNGSTGENSRMSGTKYPVSFDRETVFANMNQYSDQNNVTISNAENNPYALASYFGRVNYAFKDRYLFSATLRADGSSRFAPTHQWGYFPAAAVAWRLSEEPFIKSISAIDNLKLRLSFGEAGNDRIDFSLWKMLWNPNSGGYSYSDVGNTYYAPASTTIMTNPDLKWETTITRNAGIDFSLFKSRIYGTIDGYWNTTKDILMMAALPPYTGYTSQMANVAQTRNLGIELSIGGDIIRTNDLKISANLNIGFNRNKVEKLSDEMKYYYYSTSNGGTGWASNSTRPTGGDFALITGQPVGLIRGYVNDGFYTTSDFNYNSATKTYTLKDGVANSYPSVLSPYPGIPGVYPGMLKLKKLGTTSSAINVNESDDATIIGNTNPKNTGGFNLNATYKSFDLLLAFNWSYGNDIYNANKLLQSSGIKTPFRNFSDANNNWYHIFDVDTDGNLVRVYDPAALDALNVNAKAPMPFQESGVAHSGGIEDGSFLRLNNVTLGYTLPSKLTNRIAIQKFRIYATINNAWLWTKYTGYDPEVDAGTGNSFYPTPGMDYGAYPKARTFTFGVNVNF